MIAVHETVWAVAVICLWLAAAAAHLRLKRRPALALSGLPLLAHAAWIVWRTASAGRAPFSSIYESLVFFAFLLFLKALALMARRERPVKIALLLPGMAALIAALLLPADLKEPGATPPVLQSVWLFVHVPAVFWAYVSLTLAAAIRIAEIAGRRDFGALFTGELRQAFFFLTLGIVTGAFWAEVSWGEFWSWDPKETWALATWLLTGLALHLRSRAGTTIAVGLAVAAMLFTYFGVTFLLPGLHSYSR